ncbi:MAG: ScpA family protein [Acidimicrobiales bacterium]|nr:ScpA family protein [Acidimicrobiales bacterium]
MSVNVMTPVYEGPFELLLNLILKEEVELYEVSLSTIVDRFLVEMEQLEDLDLELATEFLLIASILVELKTRRLLPGRDRLDLDEEFGLWEQRDLLLARLLECKTFKDAAVVLRGLAASAAMSWPRRSGLEERFLGMAPDLLEGVTADDLHDAFLRAMAPRPSVHVDTEHIAPIRVSVADAVVALVSEIPRSGSVTFRHLTRSLVDRIEIVVRFLAVLELYKQGVVEIDQLGAFGDIHVGWRPGADPSDVDLVDAYEG